jgi:hypothetical protein
MSSVVETCSCVTSATDELWKQKEDIDKNLSAANTKLWDLQYSIRKRLEEIQKVGNLLGGNLSNTEFDTAAKQLDDLQVTQTKEEAEAEDAMIEVSRLDAAFKAICGVLRGIG